MKLKVFLGLGWICITFVHGFIAPLEASDPSNNYDIQQIVTKWKNEEANKQIVRTFYQSLLGDKDISSIDKYVHPQTYIQHNPTIADGPDALKKEMTEWFPPGSPKTKVDLLKIGADDDLVYVHTRTTKHNNPASVVDIFRLASGKLVEHWDVHEELTPEVLAASKNDHPFF